jgi:hypothetical protein
MFKNIAVLAHASKYLAIFLGILCMFSHVVYGAPPQQLDPASFENTSSGFQHFYQNIAPYVENVVTSSAISDFATTLWKFFSVVLIVWVAGQGVYKGYDLGKVIALVFTISAVRILMLNYDSTTAALWSWSEGLSTSIQTSAIGVDDKFFAPRYLWNLLSSINWDTGNMLFHFQNVVASLILGATAMLLSVLAFFASAWALWGYSIAKMIGLTFIPFLLFERLSWLFDGWLRFFFGFLIYNILAKAMLMLVIFAVSAYFNLPADNIPQQQGYHLVINTITDILGLMVFIVISIFGLTFTGTFVKSLVAGSNVGSISGCAQSLHSGMQQMGRVVAAVLK